VSRPRVPEQPELAGPVASDPVVSRVLSQLVGER
jgi:hypothetical protein